MNGWRNLVESDARLAFRLERNHYSSPLPATSGYLGLSLIPWISRFSFSSYCLVAVVYQPFQRLEEFRLPVTTTVPSTNKGAFPIFVKRSLFISAYFREWMPLFLVHRLLSVAILLKKDWTQYFSMFRVARNLLSGGTSLNFPGQESPTR